MAGEDDQSSTTSWSNFAENSSIHGIKYLTSSNSSKINRLIWVITIVFCGVVGAIISEELFTSLLRRDTSTHLRNIQSDSLTFPKVVMCDHNSFKKDAVDRVISTKDLVGLDEFLERVFSFRTRPSHTAVNWSEPQYEKLMNIDPEELYSLLFEMSPKPSEVFPFTAYLGQVHDPDVLLTPIMTDLGICYEFNADGAFNLSMAGMDSGLTLVTHIAPDDYYIGFLTYNTGISILFYDQDDVPMVKKDAFTGVRPGTFVSLALTKYIIKRQPPPANGNTSNCFDALTAQNPLQSYEKYSSNGCNREREAQLHIKMCGCRSLFDPVIDNSPRCGPHKQIQCIPSISKEERQKIHSAAEAGACRESCHTTKYKTQTALFGYPNVAFMQLKFGQSPEESKYLKENIAGVEISFQSMSHDELEEYIPYTWKDVLASLGGTLGLCVGASLLSFAEFLQFIFNLCLSQVRKRTSLHRRNVVQVKPTP